MAELKVKEDRFDSRYTVTEKCITYGMGFSWHNSIHRHIHRTYHHLYNEEAGGAYAWYRILTLPDRKEIRAQGLTLNNGFYPNIIHEG